MFRRSVCLGVTLALSGGCFSQSVALHHPVSADLRVGAMADSTAFERAGAAPSSPGIEDIPPSEKRDRQRARTATFWIGVVAASLGGGGAIGFAAAGQVSENKIAEGYERRTLTRSQEDRLEDRGTLFNQIAIGSGALALVGVVMASVAYGLDYTQCGKLARRKDCKRNETR
jgi:hypothetical protein